MRGPDQRKVRIARSLRREATSAELRLWAELRNRQLDNFKFVRQVPIGNYVADFACREAQLLIEVDGATHSTEEEVRRDASRTAFLEGLGYSVLRFQNEDIYEAMEGVLLAIRAALRPSSE